MQSSAYFYDIKGWKYKYFYINKILLFQMSIQKAEDLYFVLKYKLLSTLNF